MNDLFDLSEIISDESKAEEGVWFTFNEKTKSRLLICAATSDRFKNGRLEELEGAKSRLAGNLQHKWGIAQATGTSFEDFLKENDPVMHDKVMMRSSARLVLGMERFSMGGKPVDYSPKLIRTLIDKSLPFALFVSKSASKDEAFWQTNDSEEESVAKKSTDTSSGHETGAESKESAKSSQSEEAD